MEEGLVSKLVGRLGDEKKACSVLLSLLNVMAMRADTRFAAGGLTTGLADHDLFVGPPPTEGQLPGVEFMAEVKHLDPAARLAALDEYLAICAEVPSWTVAQHFAEIVRPREAARALRPTTPPVGPAASPDVAPQKPDASFTIPFAEIGLRIAIERRDGAAWGGREELEPGLWFQVELKFDKEDWFLDAYHSYDADGRHLAADAPAHVGGKVYGVYKFMEAQRWVTVETVPQVAAVVAGPDIDEEGRLKITTVFEVFVEENPDAGVYRGVSRLIRLAYDGDDELSGVGRLHTLLGRASDAAPAIVSLDATSTSLRVGWRDDPRSGISAAARKDAVVDAWRDVFAGGIDDVEHFVARDAA